MTFSECITRLLSVPFLSAKNSNIRLKLAWTHQHWTIDRKVLPDITSLNISCGIQIVGSEFGISHLKFLEKDNEFNMLINTHPHRECHMKECQFL